MKEKHIDILHHNLVPKHIILSEQEKQEVINKYQIKKLSQFPRILKSDPIVKLIGAKPGDLIKIERENSDYYRVVVED
ncbi:MAG: DNA-directed RNA polymerase subunit H [Candidatus Aenigmarchaeota archaeon]|nr:DNA-directed RNA polymerase subunit H [Candidatus Aenigmarchaeota archaeon]